MGKKDGFMPDTTLLDMILTCKKEPAGKAREMMQAAIMRKRGKTQAWIASHLHRPQSTISDWLKRLEDRGLEGRHDRKSPGRKCRLSEDQQKDLKEALGKKPLECKFERGDWTAGLVSAYISREFGVKYGREGALALSHRLNCTMGADRPVHYKTLTEEEEVQYVKDTVEAISKYASMGHTVLAADAAAFANGSSTARGLRPAGSKRTTRVNYSKKTLKVIGAIGTDVCHLNFCDSANSDSFIELLDLARAEHGKLFVILDNAKAHTSKKVKQYVKGTNGDVVLWYLPPYTPQHNPIEILWRELKRAIACRYYDRGFPQMQKSMVRMITNGEVTVPKLFGYMLDAIQEAKNCMPLQSIA